MLEQIVHRVKQVGAIVLGAFFYMFVLLFDLVAWMVNSVKGQLQIPQLTDFRREEELPLHIPRQFDLPNRQIILKAQPISEYVSSFEIPLIQGDPSDVLIDIKTNQQFNESTEIELCLSGSTDGSHSETIFLFIHPFMQNPTHQYPNNQLWFTIPPDRSLTLTCIDVQPKAELFRFSCAHVSIMSWR